MTSGLFKIFGRNAESSDAPASSTPEAKGDAQPPVVPEAETTVASPRVMKDIIVLQTARDLPHYRVVLTDRDHKYHIREEDRSHVAMLEINDGHYAIVWTNLPSSRAVYDELAYRIKLDGVQIRQVFEAPSDVIALLYRTNGTHTARTERLESQRTPVHEEINDMVREAVRLNASDIHLQVDERTARIRFRVQGSLIDFKELRTDSAHTLSNALFTAADSDKPTAFTPNDYQDASITHEMLIDGQRRVMKLRFASLKANMGGWDIVLRLLSQDARSIPDALPRLGYDAMQIFDFDRMLARPTGLVCLCGTTGSGKSTTTAKLLEMLNVRHKGTRLIRTIEDPVEYVIEGARQHPVVRLPDENEGENRGFLKAFRACMRGDPDIIMVGEVRDRSTAELLQHAVQSGHKVFATVHASTAFDGIFRLIHMGVGRADLASDQFISGMVFQRLLRMLCPACSVPLARADSTVPLDLRRRLMRAGVDRTEGTRVAGPGCATCRHTGYAGRTAVAEMVIPNRDMLHHILRDERMLAKAYWRAGLASYDISKSGRTALDQALMKMAQGQVSPLDVEAELGHIDDQRSPEEELAWYQKATAVRGMEPLQGYEAGHE